MEQGIGFGITTCMLSLVWCDRHDGRHAEKADCKYPTQVDVLLEVVC